MSTDIKITTEMLYKGALIFALMDTVCVALLIWRVKEEAFRMLKWPLAISAAWVWYGIWSWALSNYWKSVYSYVFPTWARIGVPRIALIVAGIIALGLHALALKFKGKMILSYCFSGGLIGSLTHIWAVHLGIVTKPPMLQGASPLAAVVFAFFEFMFYWCMILVLANILDSLSLSSGIRRHYIPNQ